MISFPLYCRQCCAVLLAGLVLLLGATAPVSAAGSPRLQQARQAFELGDYATAYRTLQPLQAAMAGSADYDFLLGRAAYEVRDFETAIFAFERVLIARPESDRTRLELARTFFAAGDLEASRSYFNAVLRRDTPQTVRQNIEAFLSRIDQAQRHNLFGGMLAVGGSYDDNVHAAPVDETISTLLGTVTLDGAGRPQDDLSAQATLLLNHAWRFDGKPLVWQTSLTSHGARYRDADDLDLNLVGLSSGPVWTRGNLQASLQGDGVYLQLDGARYLTSLGGTAALTWAPNPRTSLGARLRAARINYLENVRDANQYLLELQGGRLWGRTRLSLNLALEYDRARDPQYGYLRETAGLRLERPLVWALIGAAGYSYQNTCYRHPADLFGVSRHDGLHELSAGLTRPLWRHADGSQLLLQLNHSYFRSESNIGLYDYTRNLTTLSLNWLF